MKKEKNRRARLSERHRSPLGKKGVHRAIRGKTAEGKPIKEKEGI